MSLSRAELALSLHLFVESEGGTREIVFSIVSFVSSFNINDIPICEVEIAIGANISKDDGSVSPGDDITYLKKSGTKATVQGAFDGEMYPGGEWPSGQHILFEGIVMSSGSNVSHASAEYKVTLAHWLMHLQTCQAVSRYLDPSSITRRDFSTTLQLDPDQTANGDAPRIVQSYLDFDDDKVTEDLWAHGVRQVLASFMESENAQAKADGSIETDNCAELLSVPTDAGVAAFARIQGPSESLPKAYSDYAVPVQLQVGIGELAPPGVFDSIMRLINGIGIEYLQSSSIWSVLTAPGGILSQLQLALVPLVDSAIVVPICRSLTDHYETVISTYDSVSFQRRSSMHIPVRAVAVGGQTRNIAGALNTNDTSFGCFPKLNLNIDTKAFGVLHTENLPEWLKELTIPGTPFRDDITLPGVANPDKDNVAETEDNEKMIDDAAALVESIAETIYVDMKNMASSGFVVSRLRFDISPGSTVRITNLVRDEGEVLSSNHLRHESAIDAVAYVMNVTTIITTSASGSPTCYTQYNLSHVRDITDSNYTGGETSSESDRYSVARPPLYARAFKGAPLVETLRYARTT
jgi:hypothetical protein